jgi:hypothetical protein
MKYNIKEGILSILKNFFFYYTNYQTKNAPNNEI